MLSSTLLASAARRLISNKARSCYSSAASSLARQAARPGSATPNLSDRSETFVPIHQCQRRLLSSPTQQPPPGEVDANVPSSLTEEMALGVQDATTLFLKYGLGKRRLDEIAKEAGQGSGTLVARWQKMMEAFLGTQVHVLAGLGYPPNERGIGIYNQQLTTLMQSCDPDTQEKLRVTGRDTWRSVLAMAFGIPMKEIEEAELSIVDARNVMHKVSLKMQEPAILDMIEKKCASVESTTDGGDDAAMSQAELQLKHSLVQDVLVNQVYLGGDPTLVSDCGFGDGERGYVFMQCVMAEHQSDPLVSQYIGNAMMQVLKSAGLDAATLQKMAEAEATAKGS